VFKTFTPRQTADLIQKLRGKTYAHLPHRNVANTDLGYHLYQSGLIRAAAKP